MQTTARKPCSQKRADDHTKPNNINNEQNTTCSLIASKYHCAGESDVHHASTTAMKDFSTAATMPAQQYPRRDSNPKKRTEPWQIRSSSVKILTSVLSRKPDYGIARPSRKWLLRQEKRMRDFPDELLSIAGHRKYNRMTTGSAVLETMEGVLRRLTTSSSSGTGKAKSNVSGQGDLTSWKRSKANLCDVHEVLDSHLINRIFMAIAHETSTHTNVLRGFISDEISAIERSTGGQQINMQQSRTQSETTLVVNEEITQLAALLQRLDSITSYWIDYKTFEKNFHGSKPYDESGTMVKVENRCDACILAAVGANVRALCDLRALTIYRWQRRRHSSTSNDQPSSHDDHGWSGTTGSLSLSNLRPKPSSGSKASRQCSENSTTSDSRSSDADDGSLTSRPEEPVLLRYLDGWISALKKRRSEPCRAESEALAALLFSYQAEIQAYRDQHAHLRGMGAEGPTTFREVRVTRAVSRSTGRRREELFDLVPCQEEVEFGTHTRYGTPIAYLVPSTMEEEKRTGPKYHGFCTSQNTNLEKPYVQNVHPYGSVVNSEIAERGADMINKLQDPAKLSLVSSKASVERSRDFLGVMGDSSSSVYSQDHSKEIEHANNKATGISYNSAENIDIFLDEQEARRLAQSETIVRDWQARCVFNEPQTGPPEDEKDDDGKDYIRLADINQNNSYATGLAIAPKGIEKPFPATPFTHHSAVPPPLRPKNKDSDGSAHWRLQHSEPQADASKRFTSASANREHSDTSMRRNDLLKEGGFQCRFCSGNGCRSCTPFAFDTNGSSVLVSNSPPVDIFAKDYTQMPSYNQLPLNYDDCVVECNDHNNDGASEWTDISAHTQATHPTVAAPFTKRDEIPRRACNAQNRRPRAQTICEENEGSVPVDDDSLSYLKGVIDKKGGRLQDQITPKHDELIMNLPSMKPPRTDFCKAAFGETSTVYKFPMHSDSHDLSSGVDYNNDTPQLSPRQLGQYPNAQYPPTPQVLDKRLFDTDRPSYQAWLKNIKSLENVRDTPLKPSDTTVDSYLKYTSRYEQIGTPTKSGSGATNVPRLAIVSEACGLEEWERHGIENSRDWEEIGVPPLGHVPTHGQLAPPPLKIRSFLERVADSRKTKARRRDKSRIENEKQAKELKCSQNTHQKPPLQISSCYLNARPSGYNVATRGRSASVLADDLQPTAPERPLRSPEEASVRKESYATQITDLLAQYQHESQRGRAR